MTEQQRQRAIQRIRDKREFWVHLAVYLAVNTLLVVIWALTASEYFWPLWPILGWGIAIVVHAVRVYWGSAEISEAQIEREMHGRLGSQTSAHDEFG